MVLASFTNTDYLNHGLYHWEKLGPKSMLHDDIIKWKHFCAGNSPVNGEFPTQRPVTRSFDAFFDLWLNKRLSKQSWGWWSEMPSHSLWCHCNVVNKDFLTWPLTGWQLCRQPLRSQVWNLLTNRDFNMEFSQWKGLHHWFYCMDK